MNMKEKNKPVNEIRIGSIRATIWGNEGSGSDDSWFSVTVSRLFKDANDSWRSSSTFRQRDIPMLIKALDGAFTWIGTDSKLVTSLEALQDEVISLKTQFKKQKPTKKKAK